VAYPNVNRQDRQSASNDQTDDGIRAAAWHRIDEGLAMLGGSTG